MLQKLLQHWSSTLPVTEALVPGKIPSPPLRVGRRRRPAQQSALAYHVEDMATPVTHLTAQYNVVALIHSQHVPEVRNVTRRPDDPFLSFPRVLFHTRLADPDYAPLFYGPYCIYRSLDATWYQVIYEQPQNLREPIQIPFRAGWRLIAIKTANWRYSVVRVLAKDSTSEELLVRTGPRQNEPFLLQTPIRSSLRIAPKSPQ